MRWEPSDPARWAHLNLADQDPSGCLPQGALVADVLVWALALPGAVDPVEGIVDGVRVELAALADVLSERRVATVLLMLGRRLDAAMLLLRWTDNRAQMPTELDEPRPPPAATTEHAEDLEVTRDAAPDEGGGT
jgi:hypothetical protein